MYIDIWMDIWTDSIQCVEKEDQRGILDFWPEQLRCGKSKVWGEYGGGKIKSSFLGMFSL